MENLRLGEDFMDKIDEINEFLHACNDLINSNFILSKSKLTEIFKTIAASENLKKLFYRSVEGYHYCEAKQKYFVSSFDGKKMRSIVFLPDSVKEKVAFIFCLLVELEKDCIEIGSDKLSLENFLDKYFNTFGDFSKSFLLFCEKIIIPFRLAVAQQYHDMFESSDEEIEEEFPHTPESIGKAEGNTGGKKQTDDSEGILSEAPNEAKSKSEAIEMFGKKICACAEKEQRDIHYIQLTERQIEIATKILDEIMVYSVQGNITTVKALIWGYNYLLLYCNYTSSNVDNMYKILEEFGGKEI